MSTSGAPKYPTLGMMGGIDKRALAQDPEAIDRELQRINACSEKRAIYPGIWTI